MKKKKVEKVKSRKQAIALSEAKQKKK